MLPFWTILRPDLCRTASLPIRAPPLSPPRLHPCDAYRASFWVLRPRAGGPALPAVETGSQQARLRVLRAVRVTGRCILRPLLNALGRGWSFPGGLRCVLKNHRVNAERASQGRGWESQTCFTSALLYKSCRQVSAQCLRGPGTTKRQRVFYCASRQKQNRNFCH